MKIYLADTSVTNRYDSHRKVQSLSDRLRILVSFHYYRQIDVQAAFARAFAEPYPELFLDSGAFSAASSGVIIDLAQYCAFIERYSQYFGVYANLDSIGNARHTLANQRSMEGSGLAPLPVFHVGEPWRYLEDYLARYRYLALGGMVPYMHNASQLLFPWLVKCFKLAQGRAVYHGFGCTSWQVMRAFPWYSVDSSSWSIGNRYGRVQFFDDEAGEFISLQLGERRSWYRHAEQLRRYGYDPAHFASREQVSQQDLYSLSSLSFTWAEAWLERRHGPVSIPACEARL